MSVSSKQASELFLEMRTAEINSKAAYTRASHIKHAIMHELRAEKAQTKISAQGIADAAIVHSDYQQALEAATAAEHIFANAQAKWIAFAVDNDIPWCADVRNKY